MINYHQMQQMQSIFTMGISMVFKSLYKDFVFKNIGFALKKNVFAFQVDDWCK